ncbi:Oidioi.mRNA.OKI2018_I69.chr2.g4183.t2.cds [Oikopleura dioica]|uniref:Oidioi.mRNA.OKI2018_I69.chr2.g4183.t2.cds n=1 Tax=Oikopleura dioica TaxID=34765 RepID=A0ABN7T0R8_OIKDI|nr:Oidioi.mRNA.OKI2018_I69.chr2.g4183.t2.cds [Oikopleura dioica]
MPELLTKAYKNGAQGHKKSPKKKALIRATNFNKNCRSSSRSAYFRKASYVYDDLMEKRQYFNNMLPEMSVMEPVFGRRKATLRRRLQNYIRANRRSSV